MADQAQDPKPNPGERKSRGKTIILLAAVFIGEAALIIGLMMFVGRPASVQAGDSMPAVELSEDEKIVETLILDERLANGKIGVTYLYETEIYVQTRRKFEQRVKSELEQFQNEIKADINAIWRTAEPHTFQEPRLETLTRKVYALLNDRFGTDDETGEPIIAKCVVVMGTGFRVDS